MTAMGSLGLISGVNTLRKRQSSSPITSVDPDHDCHGLVGFDLRSEHVEEEAILLSNHLPLLRPGTQPLRARRRGARRLFHISPRPCWPRTSGPSVISSSALLMLVLGAGAAVVGLTL